MGVRYLSNYISKFHSKKTRNEKVSDLYEFLYADTGERSYQKKAFSIKNCGSYLDFAVDPSDLSRYKLVGANFCRERLCPMCSWRKELRLSSEMAKCIEVISDRERLERLSIPSKYLKNNKKYHFLLVTFTLKNCSGDDLSETIDDFLYSYGRKLMRKNRIKKCVYGSFRSLEITYNKDENMYHPHIHAIWIVPTSYFSNPDFYISQKRLCELWADSCGIDYNPICDIRKIELDGDNSVSSAVMEVCKYVVKDEEYISVEDPVSASGVLSILDNAIKNRRLVSFDGLFKVVRKELFNTDQKNICLTDSLDDIENVADMLHFSCVWHSGYHFLDFGGDLQKYLYQAYQMSKDLKKEYHDRVKKGEIVVCHGVDGMTPYKQVNYR